MTTFKFNPDPHTLSPIHFCGIPTICGNGRELIAIWYGGGMDEQAGNYLIAAASGDRGSSWTEPKPLLVASDPQLRIFDPCLWRDKKNDLNLCFSVAKNKTDEMKLFRTRRCNEKWTAPEYLAPGVALNKPAVTSKGTLLLPVAKWDADGSDGIFSSRVYHSTDGGGTFELLSSVEVPGHCCDEPMIIEEMSGNLKIFVRTHDGISESVSTDGGKSWTRAIHSSIFGANSRFFISRLSSGKLLMINHAPRSSEPPKEHRYPEAYGQGWERRCNLYIFLSEDDGKTWPWRVPLDTGELVSYPDAYEDTDGSIHIVWDQGRYHLHRIKHAVITEEEIISGNGPVQTHIITAGPDSTSSGRYKKRNRNRCHLKFQ